MVHIDLVANGYEALGKVIVVLPHEVVGDHEIVDIVEYERSTLLVLFFGLHKCDRVVTPVTARVEMMRGVPAVVEAVAITLVVNVSCCLDMWISEERLTGTSINVMLERKSESGSTSSTKACCPQFPTIIAMRMTRRGSIRTKRVARKFCLASM